MTTPLPGPYLSPVDGYRLWAGSYDDELNPMLSLERQYLSPLLENVTGLDVVDFGCGTGRWLEMLKDAKTRSLVGIDCSVEMLDVARRKLGVSAKLITTKNESVPLPSNSADVVLCNFVLSYIEEASSVLQAINRVLREGGLFFVTDLHPETATALNWRRGANRQNGFHEIRTHSRSVAEVVALCESTGLVCDLCIEPRFGETERDICERAGKKESFELAANYPAIYILQLRRPSQNLVTRSCVSDTIGVIQGARLALSANSSVHAELGIRGGKIQSLGSDAIVGLSPNQVGPSIDLSGFLMLPGLVNAHDHLEFALFPRLGKGNYKNFLEWAEDIHTPTLSPILEHRQVPRDVRLVWGGIRNLISGATTVCHHNPYHADVFGNNFPVRVLADYGWAHSLPMDTEAAAKKKNTPKGQPFLIHLAEGVDRKSAEELSDLWAAGALDEDTVIIHGLGLRKRERERLRSSGAGLIWCPSSNVFLFGKTLSSSQIRAFPRLALGSDSPITARGDLLDEIRYARGASKITNRYLYRYVTDLSAEILRLKRGEGTLRVGGLADIVVIRDSGLSPADALAKLSYRDIELVIVGGRVHLASTNLISRLPAELRAGLQSLSIEGNVRWIRAPLDRLFHETSVHLRGAIRLGGKQVSLAA